MSSDAATAAMALGASVVVVLLSVVFSRRLNRAAKDVKALRTAALVQLVVFVAILVGSVIVVNSIMWEETPQGMQLRLATLIPWSVPPLVAIMSIMQAVRGLLYRPLE